jgi:hypothetical protein
MIEVLLETGCFYDICARGYLEDNWGDQVRSVRESVKRGLVPEAEEYSLLEPLPGNV